jgi:hypothetical protein
VQKVMRKPLNYQQKTLALEMQIGCACMNGQDGSFAKILTGQHFSSFAHARKVFRETPVLSRVDPEIRNRHLPGTTTSTTKEETIKL